MKRIINISGNPSVVNEVSNYIYKNSIFWYKKNNIYDFSSNPTTIDITFDLFLKKKLNDYTLIINRFPHTSYKNVYDLNNYIKKMNNNFKITNLHVNHFNNDNHNIEYTYDKKKYPLYNKFIQ